MPRAPRIKRFTGELSEFPLPHQVGLGFASGLLLTWWTFWAIRSVTAATAGMKQIEALKGHLVDIMPRRVDDAGTEEFSGRQSNG